MTVKEQEAYGTAPTAIADISHLAVLRGDRRTVATAHVSRTGVETRPDGG